MCLILQWKAYFEERKWISQDIHHTLVGHLSLLLIKYPPSVKMRLLNLKTIAKHAICQGKIKIYTSFRSKISSLLPPGKSRSWATFALWEIFTRVWFQVPLNSRTIIEILLFFCRMQGSGNRDLCFTVTAQQLCKSWGENEFQVPVSHFFSPEWKVEETRL